VTTILMIFLRINSPNFVQFEQWRQIGTHIFVSVIQP